MNLSFRVGDEPGNVTENRRLFFAALGGNALHVAVPLQCHSNTVKAARLPGEYASTDGLVTNVSNLTMAVTVADCLAVVLFDPVKRASAIVHAGWKGTARSITAKSVALLKEEYGSSSGDLLAFLSPSARVCCYEVGPEVAEEFSSEVVERRQGKLFLDLKKANVNQLLKCGVKSELIEVSDQCTICNPQLFHSHRREGDKSGRMMAAVCLVNVDRPRNLAKSVTVE
jgi:YfiH family protein